MGEEGNPVIFVGGGPGDPELVSVAGARALRDAELVVYTGSLLGRRLVERWCRENVEAVDSAPLVLEEFIGLMAEAHQAGKKVVRLQTGDPSVFGALDEQLAALEARGVPWKVIPGVTAAFAAAARMGLSYTRPGGAQGLVITRVAARTPGPGVEQLERLAREGLSVAVYLSVAQAGQVGQALGRALGPKARVVVAWKVGWEQERIFWTTAGELAQRVREEGVGGQAVILAGGAVGELDRGRFSSRLYDPDFSHGFRRGGDGRG